MRGDDMGNICYTIQELQTIKLYELPNRIYNQIMVDLARQIGIMTPKLNKILDNANLFQLDQYINIYKYIRVL